MIKRSIFCVLAVGLLLPSTGCHCLSSWLCCQPACGGPAVGYAVGDCGGCGNCDDCLGAACDVGRGYCGRPCFPLIQSMFGYVQRLHNCMCGMGCGPMGCGPAYTEEWTNGPSGCGSSCGGCGNCGGGYGSAYQAPYDVSPYVEPQPAQEPNLAPEPSASRTSYRPNRHRGRIAVGI